MPLIRFFVLYLAVFTLMAGTVKGQTDIWGNDIKADLYECNLNKAKNELDSRLANDPENPYLQRLINHYDFLNLLFFESNDRQNVWLNEVGNRIQCIENAECKESDRLFMLAESNLHACMLYLTSKNEIKAVSSFRHGFEAYQELEKTDPDAAGTIKLRGLFNLMIGLIPEKYNWLASVLGMEGDFDLGVKYLEQAYRDSDNPGDFYELAFYYAMFAAGYSDSLDSIYSEFMNFTDEKKRNPLIRQAISLMAESSGKTSGCLAFLESYYHNQGDTYLGLLDFQIGKFMLYELDPEAGIYLDKYICNTKNTDLTLNAHRNMYWHYLITGQSSRAESQRQKTLQIAQSVNSPQAEYIINELSEDNPPDILLLKSRLLFNGGNYNKAAETIKKFDITKANARQTCEFYYRKASIEDKQNLYNQALLNYKKAVASGKENEWYFAPKSALNAGIIYEKRGDTDIASDFYKLCIKINKSHYKENINQEAKSRLKRIKNRSQDQNGKA